MIKFGVALILIALFGYAAWLYNDVVPWYGFAVGSLLVGWAVPQKGTWSWLSGFLAIAVLWLWLISKMDAANEGLLATKMVKLIPVGDSPYVLIALCCLIGGIVSGFASLTGNFMRRRQARVSQ